MSSFDLPTVVNRIIACRNTNCKILPYAALKFVILHRTDLCTLDLQANPHPIENGLLDGPELAERFKNRNLGTAGLTPYHFLIRANDPDFTIEQLIPITLRGAHAIGYNWRSLAVACVGDFRTNYIPHKMWNSLCELLALLIPINGGLDVVGHTDLPGAAADPNKVCPGQHLSPVSAKAQALSILPIDYASWNQGAIDHRLIQAGILI